VQYDVRAPELRIWKHSHGTSSVSPEDRQKLRKRSVLTIYRDTGKKQGENFRTRKANRQMGRAPIQANQELPSKGFHVQRAQEVLGSQCKFH